MEKISYSELVKICQAQKDKIKKLEKEMKEIGEIANG